MYNERKTDTCLYIYEKIIILLSCLQYFYLKHNDICETQMCLFI